MLMCFFYSIDFVGSQTTSCWFNWLSWLLCQSMGCWNRRMWVQYIAPFFTFIDIFTVEIHSSLKFVAFYGFLENPAYFVLRIVLIVIGSVYLNDCQAEPMLPIFLIVFGIIIIGLSKPPFSLDIELSLLLWIGAVGLLMQIIDPWETAKDTCVYYLLAFFSFCWWITGGPITTCI